MKEIQAGTVSRYCKPYFLDENGNPTARCFELRKNRNEKYLSVCLLEFFDKPTEKEKLVDVKNFMEKNGFSFKSKAAGFALLDIEKSKEYIFQKISEKISYREVNSLPHCGIFHESYGDLPIAERLAQCVKIFYSMKNL